MRVYALACLFSKIGGSYAAGGAEEQGGRAGFDVIQAAYSGRLLFRSAASLVFASSLPVLQILSDPCFHISSDGSSLRYNELF